MGPAAVGRIYDTVYETADRSFSNPVAAAPNFKMCVAPSYPACVRERLPGFLRKAFRRPAAPDSLAAITKVFDDGGGTPEALRKTLLVTLLWPRFWFVVRTPHLTLSAALDSFDVAERLALSMWGSFPDDELSQLADNRQILEATVLAKQTDRLLKDPKASFFFEQFTTQWLGMGRLDAVGSTEKRLAKLGLEILGDMKRETLEFVRQIILQGRPQSEIVTLTIPL